MQDIIEYADENNFDYYYNKLKKINLLKDYQKIGIDISDFYCEDLTKPKAFEINKKFEELKIGEISEAIKKKIFKVELFLPVFVQIDCLSVYCFNSVLSF